MSDTDNQDFYEGSAADAPLIDSLGSAVKRLIDKGKVRGYITVEELNKALPPEKESSEQIEDIMSEISDMGISIISESDADNFEPDVVEEEDDYDESGNFDEKDLGRSDDPVRMYLKEMGTVELLSREGEIAIAKRIEAGKTVMIDGLCESPMTLKAIAGWRDDLVEGKMQLRDIVDLEMMYGDDPEALAYEDDEAPVDLDKVAEELAKRKIWTTLTTIWKTTLSWKIPSMTRLKTRTTLPTWAAKATKKPRLPGTTMMRTASGAGHPLRFRRWKRLCWNRFWKF